MTNNNKEKTEQSGQDQVIDRLYDVAINPILYEDLIDAWEESYSLDGSRGAIPPDDNDVEFGGHARVHVRIGGDMASITRRYFCFLKY